jgi:hypothetical protein
MKFIHDVNSPVTNLVELKAAHEEALAELEKIIPVACEREGHQWDNERGKLDQVCTDTETKVTGPWWDEDYELVGCNPVDVYRRTCTRCGKKEVKRAVTKISSPFTEK